MLIWANKNVCLKLLWESQVAGEMERLIYTYDSRPSGRFSFKQIYERLTKYRNRISLNDLDLSLC